MTDRANPRADGRGALAVLLLAAALSLPTVATALPEEVLYSFGMGGDGITPVGGLIQAADGSFYGTAGFGSGGGSCSGCGTVFRITATGGFATVHDFAGAPDDGANPSGTLVQTADGTFYGTTGAGGSGNCTLGCGTVFKMDAAGKVTVLHNFLDSPDGKYPRAGLLLASDGNFYGTTVFGGSAGGHGTVFKMDPAGNVSILHSFAGNSSEGGNPFAPLIQASDGNFYGTTSSSLSTTGSSGTVFKMDSAGHLTTLHRFTGGVNDGAVPYGGLVQATNGNFYGTTANGGTKNFGTVFRMDSAGHVTVLHGFAGTPSDGGGPSAGLIGNGIFYGTTGYGGTADKGTVFRIDPSGTVAILHSFKGYNTDGSEPNAPLTRAADGSYYGTAQFGGSTNGGAIFRWTCAPAPVPSITVAKWLTADTAGLTASVSGNPGDTYHWTLVGGTITSGQGTASITFTSGGPGTLITLDIVETNPLNCYGADLQRVQVDFLDEPPSDPFYHFVCTLGRNRVTSGCGGGNYCPGQSVTRAQMAVFLLRAKHGASYNPPACTGVFGDVGCPGGFAVDWIEQLVREGITAGCGGGNYCPDSPVTRAQMAVFLLKAEHGPTHTPPACTGVFGDVACPGGFAVDWIEQLSLEHIAAGCSATPRLYCPDAANTRGQMAVFLTTTFDLQ